MKHPGRAGLAVLALLAGCAGAPAVRVVQLDGFACRSYGWIDPPAADFGPTSRTTASLLAHQLRGEVERALAAAGHRLAADPDCGVIATIRRAAIDADTGGVSVGVGAGSGARGSVGVGVGLGVTLPLGARTRRDTALAIEVVDIAKRQQVWVGTLDAALPSAGAHDDDVARAVQAIVARLPPSPR